MPRHIADRDIDVRGRWTGDAQVREIGPVMLARSLLKPSA
jgi:hypothetical protein